jgi:hypothetical protein
VSMHLGTSNRVLMSVMGLMTTATAERAVNPTSSDSTGVILSRFDGDPRCGTASRPPTTVRLSASTAKKYMPAPGTVR